MVKGYSGCHFLLFFGGLVRFWYHFLFPECHHHAQLHFELPHHCRPNLVGVHPEGPSPEFDAIAQFWFAQFSGVRTNYWQSSLIRTITGTFSHNLLEFAQITGSSHKLLAVRTNYGRVRTSYWRCFANSHNLLGHFRTIYWSSHKLLAVRTNYWQSSH